MINLFSGAIWWDYSAYTKGYWTVSYEYQRVGNNMQYRFYWKLWLSSGAYYSDAFKLTFYIDSTAYDVTVKGTGGGSGWSYEGTTDWFAISNKLTGSTTFFVRVTNTSTGAVKATSDTYYLTVSPSAATMSGASDFNDEQNPTYNFSNPGGFVVEPYLEFLNADGSVGLTLAKYDGVPIPSGYVWTLSDAQRSQIRSYLSTRNSCKVNIGIRTTISGTYYYSASQRTFTIVNATPTLSATVVDSKNETKLLTGDPAKLIKYKSTALITISAAALKGASIVSKVVNGTLVSGTTLSIENVSSMPFTITITDSRGNTVSLILNPVVVAYIPLTVSAQFYRPAPTTGEVALQYSGNYFNGSFGAQNNALALSWAYRLKGATEWTAGGTLTPTISGNTYSEEASLGTIFDYQSNYEFILYYADKLLSTDTGVIPVTKGKPVLDWGEHDVNVNGHFTYLSEAGFSYATESESTDTALKAYLDSCLEQMPNGSQAPCRIKCYPSWPDGCLYVGTLYKTDNNYAMWVGYSIAYRGRKAVLTKYNGNWSSVVFETEAMDLYNISIPSNMYNNVKSISEYLRYSVCGRMVVVDVGGITFNAAGQGILFLTGLPRMDTRPVSFLFSDAISDASKVCCYGVPASNTVYMHVPNTTSRYYGQIIYCSH